MLPLENSLRRTTDSSILFGEIGPAFSESAGEEIALE